MTAEPKGDETLQETVAALLKQKHFEEALQAVAAFLAEPRHIDAETVQAFVEQGYIYYKMKRFRHSLAAFHSAIELDDRSGAAWVGRALALHGLVHDKESIAAYRRARDLAPQDARSLNGLGLILIANGQYDSALIALDRAQELDPYSIDISQSRLIVLRKLHRYRQYFKDLMDSTLRIWRSQQQ
jgi:tetratricopeptide (TPR) repeat protein